MDPALSEAKIPSKTSPVPCPAGWSLSGWPWAAGHPRDAGGHSRLRGVVLLVTRLIRGCLVLGVEGDVGRLGFVVIGLVKLLRDAQEVLVGDGILAPGETLCKDRREKRGDAAPAAACIHGCHDPVTPRDPHAQHGGVRGAGVTRGSQRTPALGTRAGYSVAGMGVFH